MLSVAEITGPSYPAALRLKYALKSVFDTILTEKNNDDQNTLEIFCLPFELYCFRNDF